MTEQLTGDALKQRASDLDIEGRSDMSADELRDAVEQAEEEQGQGSDAADDEDAPRSTEGGNRARPGVPSGVAEVRSVDVPEGSGPIVEHVLENPTPGAGSETVREGADGVRAAASTPYPLRDKEASE